MNTELKSTLHTLLNKSTLKILFTKKDGTERTMICSLQESLLPKEESTSDTTKSKRTANENLIHVFDLEKNGWRSIIIDNIKFYEVVE